MPSLPNYLKTHRKQTSLSQEEVAFLLGMTGMDKGIKVSRDEQDARRPTLEMALAYEAIYGRPISKLFAGMYEDAEREVYARAKILSYRMNAKINPKRSQFFSKLANRCQVSIS